MAVKETYTEKYAITYKSGNNRKYSNGKIHSRYTTWVQNLNNTIGRGLGNRLGSK